MTLVAGFATSHAPAMFESAQRWPQIYGRIPAAMKSAQPPSARAETPAVVAEMKRRIDRNFATVSAVLRGAGLDAVVLIGDDQNDMFERSNIPALSLFTGHEVWGLSGTAYTPREERTRLVFRCDGTLASWMLGQLIEEGFDFAASSVFEPRGTRDQGVSHMVAHIVPAVLPDGPPIVPLFINEYYPPLPTGRRCIELGLALRRVLDRSDQRVGVFASGGMSHDPSGPRAGWVDAPLDEWVLEQLRRNDVGRLASLFAIDSDTLRGGTSELRAWMVVAAAMDREATVVDYFPCHHAKAGLGWAVWPA